MDFNKAALEMHESHHGKVGSVSCECAEESHIHLEVMEGEKYLDPIKAMK